MKLKLLFYFFSLLIPIALSAQTQVSVFNYPGLNGAVGSTDCGTENANLLRIIQANPDFTVDASITSFSDPALLATQLDASTFFFMTDMEFENPSDLTFLPVASREVIRAWVESGGVMMMTGTYGAYDTTFLNLIFSWDLINVHSSGPWAKNVANAIGTPYEESTLSSLPSLNATDAISRNTTPNFKAIYGTDTNAALAVIEYGQGTVIFMGYDFYASGPGCYQNATSWVQQIVPASLELAATLASTITNITYTSADFSNEFSENGTTYYLLVPGGSTAPTLAQIKAGADYSDVEIVQGGSAAVTAGVEKTFSFTGLDHSTAYDIYSVAEFTDENGDLVSSSIETHSFSTVANDVPVIEEVPAIKVCPGTPVEFSISITDEFPGDSSFTVKATSGNTVLLPSDGIAISGSGTSRTFNLTPSEGETGSSTLSITVTDTEGGSSTREVLITWIDDEVPVAIAQNITRYFDETGTLSITPDEVNNGSTDNCGIASLSLDKVTFTCANVGDNDVIMTVIDNYGNEHTATATVSVLDTIRPVASLKNISLQTKEEGNYSITADDLDNGSADNCGIASRVLDVTTIDGSQPGEHQVTMTLTDTSGNITTATATVTVEDTTPPVLVCPADMTVNADAGTCAANVNFSGELKVLLLAADDESRTMEVQNKLLATDAFDAVDIFNAHNGTPTEEVLAFYQVVFFWTNNFAPRDSMLLGDRLAAYVDNGGGVVSMVFPYSALGVYSTDTYQAIVPGNFTAGDPESLGTVHHPSHPLMAGVESFNGSTSSFRGTSHTLASGALRVADWTDTTPLVVAKENVGPNNARRVDLNFFPPSSDARSDFWDASTDGVLLMQNAAFWVANTSSGNAGIEVSDNSGSVTLTNDFNGTADPSGSYPVGTTTVTLTATDAAGNTSTCSFKVIVTDTEKPEVITQNITVQLDENGTASITPEMIDNGSSDACGIESLSLNVDTFECVNVGPNTVILTVEDTNGNISTAEATVTVEDKVKPVAAAQNITVQLDENGTASITPEMIDNGSADACGIESLSLNVDTFECVNVGPNTIILTVEDTNGNISTAEATVTVEDKVKPVAAAQNITVQLDENGTASITPDMIDNGSADACGIESLSLNVDTFECMNVGPNTVILTVEDTNGNISTAEATVTVEDKVKPVAAAQNITVQLDENGTVSITPEMIDNGSADACGIESLSLNVDTFECVNVGPNTVILTVEDTNGNISTAEATVTVEDKVKPVAAAQNITVQLDENGTVSITPEMIDNGSADACGIESLSLNVDTFKCSNVGGNTVILTVEDTNGNISTAEATVTVEDKVKPVAAAQNITVQLDENGTASITPEMIDNGSSDACGIASLSLNVDAFECSNVGGNTVILTVTDNNGNISTAEATVTVEDNVTPVAVAQNITIQLDENGTASITPAMIDNGSADACGTISLSLDIDSFDCSNVGENPVIFTVEDENGNISTATATVIVEDKIAPVVTTKNITVQLDNTGSVSILPQDLVESASDNCGIESYSLDVDTFSCDQASNEVALTVTDVNGNSTTVTATVTVEDIIAPVVITRDLVIALDETGNAVITAEQLNDASLDNCGIASYSIDKASFSCAETGDHFVVLTVTDNSGNSATAEAIVTVQNLSGDNDVDGTQDNCDEDDDNDGVPDTTDNSPKDFNPDQTDSDGDGEGDISDMDNDNDGINDGFDNCPTVYNPGQEDINKDGLGDACDKVNILISEAMTPNNDGINDTWRIVNIENHPNSVVRVYNRWGNEVFSARGYRNDWNGEFKGNLLPEGSYYFQIDLEGDGNLDKDGWLYLTK